MTVQFVLSEIHVQFTCDQTTPPGDSHLDNFPRINPTEQFSHRTIAPRTIPTHGVIKQVPHLLSPTPDTDPLTLMPPWFLWLRMGSCPRKGELILLYGCLYIAMKLTESTD